MGFILSKFRKKKNTSEQLESIEQRIQSIEKFQKETEQQFRRVIGKLLISSILIYIVAVIVYYYYYSPETFRDNIIKFLPLLVFPIVIILSRRLLTWYYKRKLSKNETTLKTLKTDKKKILEEVMDKETYKVAKEILEKYAPDQLGKEKPLRAIMPAIPAKPDTIARQRLTTATPVEKAFSHLSRHQSAYQAIPNTPSALAQPKLSLPRPILQRDRGVFDKLIDLIIGDGPGNRYALICKVCSSHNGMALKHEFEYLAFRCAYCLQWNPARKQKPHAPNLQSDSGSQDESDGNNSEIDTIDTTSKQSLPVINSETRNSENEPVLTVQKYTEKIEEETDSIIETDKSKSTEESRIQENTNVDDDKNIPTDKVDLDNLHRDLDEIEEDVPKLNKTLLDSDSLPTLMATPEEPMECSR